MMRQLLLALSLVMELGLTIVVSAGLGWWAGVWLGARMGNNYLIPIIGLFLGLSGGLLAAYQLLQRFIAGGDFGDE